MFFLGAASNRLNVDIDLVSIWSLLTVPQQLLILSGARAMQIHRNLQAARRGAVAALVPLTCTWIATLPLGIVALVRLNCEETIEAFRRPRSRRTGRKVDDRHSELFQSEPGEPPSPDARWSSRAETPHD